MELHTWVCELGNSLQRAGEHFVDEVQVLEEQTGTRVVLRLHHTLPRDGIAPCKEYIKQHGETHGWNVSSVQIKPRYVTFVVSKA